MPGLLSRYPLADIVNMRILLELCPLAGLALVLWYKLLKPYDHMLVLSQEVEKMRDWPRDLESTIGASLASLLIATSCGGQSGPQEQGEERRPASQHLVRR